MKLSKEEEEQQLTMYCVRVKLPLDFREYVKTEKQADVLAKLLAELAKEIKPYHDFIKLNEEALKNTEDAYYSNVKKAEDLIKAFEDNGDYEEAQMQTELLRKLPQPHVQKRLTPRSTQAWRKEHITDILKEYNFKNKKKLLPKINTYLDKK